MTQYFTGFFTGAYLVASAVMYMGASNKNFFFGEGDITCTSLNVVDENGNSMITLDLFGQGGMIYVWNKKN